MPAITFLAALILRQITAPDDFGKVWETVSTAISQRYYARKAREADMKRLLAKYKPLASAARTQTEFEQRVNDMIAEFHDSHFAFYSDADQGYFTMDSLVRGSKAQKMPNIGAYFRQTPAGYVVQMVLDDSSAQKAGLRKGDLIQAADGAPFQPVSSFDRSGSVSLTLSRAGQVMKRDVMPEKDTAMGMFLDGTQASVHVIPYNGRKIGYIHLWTLAGNEFRDAVSGAVYGKLADTDACILDLRDGFGGRPEGYADPFFRPEMTIDWDSSMGKIHEQFGYQRPLVVLINGGSRSAKEVLSLILKKSRRATLVGSRTAGNVLGTFPMRISDWAYLEIPMVDVITDGMRLEGKGVDPDVPVAQEYDAAGKDLYLEKALALFANVRVKV